MEKLKMQSNNLTNIEQLEKLFPHLVVSTEDGKKIDFDLLKQEFSNDLVDGIREKYQLNWPGKKQALLLSNQPTTNTLRPNVNKSVDFNNTKNVYIEGDNLEVLKILQESYLNKIGIIYIDPPYNTGNDFIYNEDYKKETNIELLDSGQIDNEGNRLVSNSQSNGKYHSDWMTMMYSRLRLSRNLLIENGIISLK